jgi:hypothetical protein
MYMDEKTVETILPWSLRDLESMLRELIALGSEIPKADFKTEIELGNAEKNAELLKDITAIANTYDDHYADHGFLIYGAKPKAITGAKCTETNTDTLQGNIEQLLRENISPMVQIHVFGFEEKNGDKWGVIVIPPRSFKPYMFFKEIQCQQDRARTRKKGDWFVRKGSTTVHGLPEDLALINQRQTELLLEPMRDSIRNLQQRVAKTEEQYGNAIFKLVAQAVSTATPTPYQGLVELEERNAEIGIALGLDLPTRLKKKLRTPQDALEDDLVTEAKNLQIFLESSNTDISWTPQPNNPEENKKIIETIEEKTRELQVSVAIIVLNDDKRVYEEALLRALRILVKHVYPPNGTPFNRLGEAVRYYSIGIILYTIFVCGVYANRGDLLRKILSIPLRHKERAVTSDITEIFFSWYEIRVLINDTLAQKRCEPILDRVRETISSNIGEMLSERSESEYYFPGEFVLALTRIDREMTEGGDVERRMPFSGLYLYMHEARDVIAAFLIEAPDWFGTLYNHPITEILDMFDRNAHKTESPGCIATGMRGMKTRELYDQGVRRKAQK